MNEHIRCAHCRNPIRSRQSSVRHARGLAFHGDCWREFHRHVQEDYSVQVESDGLLGLLGPYSRSAGSWLPAAESEVVA